jgi:hypothetical protein
MSRSEKQSESEQAPASDETSPSVDPLATLARAVEDEEEDGEDETHDITEQQAREARYRWRELVTVEKVKRVQARLKTPDGEKLVIYEEEKERTKTERIKEDENRQGNQQGPGDRLKLFLIKVLGLIGAIVFWLAWLTDDLVRFRDLLEAHFIEGLVASCIVASAAALWLVARRFR